MGGKLSLWLQYDDRKPNKIQEDIRKEEEERETERKRKDAEEERLRELQGRIRQLEEEKRREEETRKKEDERRRKDEELRQEDERRREVEENRKREEKIKRELDEESQKREEKIRRELGEENRKREEKMRRELEEENRKREEKIRRELEEENRKQEEKTRKELEEENRKREERIRQEKDRKAEEELQAMREAAALQVEAVQRSILELENRLRRDREEQRPTIAHLEAVRKAREYQEGYYHFAVAGSTGCGKSSMINAIRGIGDREPNSAKTGLVETTKQIGRYPDNGWFTHGKFVWYDVPGCDTMDSSGDEVYFNKQGLYIFDAIIVAVDLNFSRSTIQIIKNCEKWNIPWYLVRSKADQHITNLTNELLQKAEVRSPIINAAARATTNKQERSTARDSFIARTRKTFSEALAQANLPPREVYIICSATLRSTIRNKKRDKNDIDEWRLLEDLARDVFDKCVVKSGERRG